MARMLLIHWMKRTIIGLLIIFLKSVNNKNIDSNITETVFYEKHIFSYLEYPPPPPLPLFLTSITGYND